MFSFYACVLGSALFPFRFSFLQCVLLLYLSLRAVYSAHINLLDLTNPMICLFCGRVQITSSSECNFLHHTAFSYIRGLYVFISKLFLFNTNIFPRPPPRKRGFQRQNSSLIEHLALRCILIWLRKKQGNLQESVSCVRVP